MNISTHTSLGTKGEGPKARHLSAGIPKGSGWIDQLPTPCQGGHKSVSKFAHKIGISADIIPIFKNT